MPIPRDPSSAAHPAGKLSGQQIRRRDLWPLWGVALLGAGLGLAATCTIYYTRRMIISRDNVTFWVSWAVVFAVTVVMPLIVLLVFHRRLRRRRHAALYGWSFGFSLVWWACLVSVAAGGPWSMPLDFGLMLSGAYGLVATVIMVVMWSVSRWARGKLRVFDGTRCPSCEYELRGCVSTVCPECGEAFAPELFEPDRTGPDVGTLPRRSGASR